MRSLRFKICWFLLGASVIFLILYCGLGNMAYAQLGPPLYWWQFVITVPAGIAPNDLHVTFAGTGGTIGNVSVIPGGTITVPGGNTVSVKWANPLNPGTQVTIDFTTEHPQVDFAGGNWTLDDKDIKPIDEGDEDSFGEVQPDIPEPDPDDPDSRTEDDSVGDPGDPDFNDSPLAPTAWHEVQHYEWLGGLVDEEPAPPFDDHLAGKKFFDDDGLIEVNFVPGQVTVKFVATTNFNRHPGAFPPGSRIYVDSWIDWNLNNTFEHPVEFIGTWIGDPNTGWPLAGGDAIKGFIQGPAIGPVGKRYSLRLRLDWHLNRPHVANPGGNADGDIANYGVSFGEVEDYFKQLTAVELSSFTANCVEENVKVMWVTGSELDNAGFNIHRNELEDGEYIRINDELISAQGNENAGANYSYIDSDVVMGRTYFYKLEFVDLVSYSTWYGPITITLSPTGVAEGPSDAIPGVFGLAQNYPNPFNVTTTIHYALPVTGERELVSSLVHTTLKIYNILGQEVVTLVDGAKEAGYHSVKWDGTDNSGQEVPSGVYLYRITAGTWSDAKRMVLLK